MRRRHLLQGVVAGSVTGTIAGCTGRLPDRGESTENPVFEPTLADPSIIRVPDGDGEPARSIRSPEEGEYEGTFYAYGTEDLWYGESDRHDTRSLQYVPIVRSSNLTDWEYVGQAFESKPDWKEGGGLWAPEIAWHDGQYHLYYAYSTWGDENPGIGVATADHPAGPFDDRGKLFDSEEIGVENSIDPYFVVDGGTPYLVWGSWYGIWVVELEDDGLGVAGEPFRIAADDRFEAPYIVERDGYYYFFGSDGHCCNGEDSDYHVVVGRAESFDGPYENRSGQPLEENPGTPILEGGDGFVGPGHNAVVRDDAGDDWIVYHAYVEGDYWIDDTPRRTLLIDRIHWEDGWPSIENGTPNRETLVPAIEE